MNTEFVVVITTSDQQEVLQRIARRLVELRLAACVQIGGPVASTYRWQDAVEESQEWTCWIKTRRGCLETLQAEVARMHNYDEPQLVVLPIESGSAGYLRWLAEQITGA